jgi:hypothetical protein
MSHQGQALTARLCSSIKPTNPPVLSATPTATSSHRVRASRSRGAVGSIDGTLAHVPDD